MAPPVDTCYPSYKLTGCAVRSLLPCASGPSVIGPSLFFFSLRAESALRRFSSDSCVRFHLFLFHPSQTFFSVPGHFSLQCPPRTTLLPPLPLGQFPLRGISASCFFSCIFFFQPAIAFFLPVSLQVFFSNSFKISPRAAARLRSA